MSNQQKGLVVRPNNPFKDDIIRFQNRLKEGSRTIQVEGMRATKITTIIETFEYFPGAFAKVYQDKEKLRDLTMEATKILFYMALNMGYEEETIKLTQELVGMERRRFSRGIIDLIMHRILVKEKPHWYWVNITVMVVGRINKHEGTEQG